MSEESVRGGDVENLKKIEPTSWCMFVATDDYVERFDQVLGGAQMFKYRSIRSFRRISSNFKICFVYDNESRLRVPEIVGSFG